MAIFTKPTVVPNWATTSGNIAVPSAGKRNLGWVNKEEPASDIENWNKRTQGEWLEWIDERFADGATADELVILSPATTDEMLKLSNAIAKWTSAAGIEWVSVAGIFTAGRSVTDGINLKGIGNVKDIEFDGTLNRISYDVSTDILSIFNDSATASLIVSKTLFSVKKDFDVTISSNKEFVVAAGVATAGRSLTDGINLKGVGNVKDIEFDGTLNRMSYDVSTDIWSLFNDSATASVIVSKTAITLKKATTIDLPLVVTDTVKADDYLFTVERKKVIGPSGWASDGAANLATGGGLFENIVAIDVSETSIDLDVGDRIKDVSVRASQAASGTMTLSLHSINSAGTVSAAIDTDTRTSVGSLVELLITGLTETIDASNTLMIRVVSSGVGIIKIGNTFITYDRPV